MTLTSSLRQFVADLSPNHLPEEAVRVARIGFVDTIGTMIAGRMTEGLTPGSPAALTFGDRHAPAPEPISAEVLFGRLSAMQSIKARDLTARA